MRQNQANPRKRLGHVKCQLNSDNGKTNVKWKLTEGMFINIYTAEKNRIHLKDRIKKKKADDITLRDIAHF